MSRVLFGRIWNITQLKREEKVKRIKMIKNGRLVCKWIDGNGEMG